MSEEIRKEILQEWLDLYGVKTEQEVDDIIRGELSKRGRYSAYDNWQQVRT